MVIAFHSKAPPIAVIDCPRVALSAGLRSPIAQIKLEPLSLVAWRPALPALIGNQLFDRPSSLHIHPTTRSVPKLANFPPSPSPAALLGREAYSLRLVLPISLQACVGTRNISSRPTFVWESIEQEETRSFALVDLYSSVH